MSSTARAPLGVAVPVVAAAVLLGAVMGARSSMGLLLGPISSTLTLGAAAVSFALAFGQLAWGAAQPLVGALAQRYGTAPTVAAGVLATALAYTLLALAVDLSTLLIGMSLISVAGAAAGGAPLLMGAVAQRVPEARRGVALGIVSAGGSAGQLLLAPVTAAALGFGWQAAVVVLAALHVLLLPAAWALRSPPGVVAAAAPPRQILRLALRDRRYLLISAGFFVCGFHVSFLTAHMPSMLELCGYSAGFAGTWLAVLGGCNLVGSVVSGWLTQRMAPARLLTLLYALRAAGLLWLLFMPTSATSLLIFALWMGGTYMATLPPTTALIARLYGPAAVALLFGLTMGLHQVGSFLGVWLGGVELQLTGGYQAVWWLSFALAAGAALLHLPIRDSARPPAVTGAWAPARS